MRGMHLALAPGVSRHITDKQAEPITQHNQHAKDRKFEVGEKVMAHNLWPKWIFGIIIKQAGPSSNRWNLYRMWSKLIKVQWKCHVDHLWDVITVTLKLPDTEHRPHDESESNIDDPLIIWIPPDVPDPRCTWSCTSVMVAYTHSKSARLLQWHFACVPLLIRITTALHSSSSCTS